MEEERKEIEGEEGTAESGEEVAPKYKLHIGCPTYGKPDAIFAMDSFASLLYHLGRRHPEIENVTVQRDVRTYRQAARQGIVEGAKQVGATHLLMLDDDHAFNGDVFDKVWESRDLPDTGMTSALYMTRGMPPVPCIWRMTPQGTVPIFYYPDDELVSVDVVGFGFVLFDMRVFEKINPLPGGGWFNLSMGFGEDAAFCARVLQAGLKVYVHTGAKIGHIMEAPRVLTEQDYLNVRGKVSTQMGTPELSFTGTDNGGSRKKQVGSRPWWRPLPTKRWFGRGGNGEERSIEEELAGREKADEETFSEVLAEQTREKDEKATDSPNGDWTTD